MIRQRLPHFNDSLYAAFNMHWEPAHIELPEPIDGDQWYVFVDTSQTSPHDIAEVGQENQVIPNRKITLAPRSCLVAVAKE